MPRGHLLRPSLRADLGTFLRLCLIIYHLLIIKIISTRVIICTLPRADWRRSFQTVPEPREPSFGSGEREGLAQGPLSTPALRGSRELEVRVSETPPGSKRGSRTQEAFLGIEVPAPVWPDSLANPLGSSFSSLGLNFPICKMGVRLGDPQRPFCSRCHNPVRQQM